VSALHKFPIRRFGWIEPALEEGQSFWPKARFGNANPCEQSVAMSSEPIRELNVDYL
jgi:hypothetical protein